VRIVLVNWAPIAEGARRGGGVNGYCQGLALALLDRGHEVVSLSSGARFDGGDLRVEASAWGRVAVREIVNSPVLAPSLAQFKEPMGEVSAPALERLVEAEIARLAPDVIHFHNIEGLSAGCIGAVRRGRPSAKIVFSLHNYHTICPQVYLLQGHRRPCFSFDHGHACEACIPAPEPAEERRRMMEGRKVVPHAAAETPRAPSAKSVFGRWFKRGEPGLPPRFVPGRGPHPWYGDEVPAWRPLLNVIQPESASHRPPNDYARRREAMVAMLNQCDAVLAVSDFVARKFAAMGVNADRIRVMHIGSRMTDLAAAARPAAPRPPLVAPDRPRRPINLAFMGYNNWYKGLPMLADALDLLVPEVLARYHLHIYALEGQQMEPIFRTIEPRLGGLTLRHGYAYEEVPTLLAGIDLGVVPSVWWDNAPQTVMEFFAGGVPVLAARLGGIPDFVEDGRNGLLFIGNHRWDLARRLAEIARDPSVIERLRAGVHPPKTMGEHAAELERTYGRAIS
jgi:glycosyltransferase involved in cell wall biosynthesis